ncbi:Na+/H+ antiporter NhaA [Thermomonospora cellulosilytica]|uniref:Na(+)/H(+) antiporter NhaA n=1 Tax=Thermomonospora cellulosilytica TaxID=1411118 RepID=A0A7W3RAD9_9ACTN|nr:Na+/H+ antiporter NhaA [Thermomonospora cellulosilytica]MBA9005205.1 NhaA family Na+:H+ antiporter [Thermomonospora cellulosilytica]
MSQAALPGVMTSRGNMKAIRDRARGGRVRDTVVEPVLGFVRAETVGGVLLLAAAVLALGWANSPLSDVYHRLWSLEFGLGAGPVRVTDDLRHWVNDGLMTVFFFVVALEIKRELVTGELRDPRAAALPALAAGGGVVLPALIFLAIVDGGPASAGWGIPMATDIAFAVGVVALLGKRLAAGVRVFLLSIAIVDDVIAIAVIATFYSGPLNGLSLAVACAGLLLVVLLRRAGVAAVWPYALAGAGIWYFTHQSGVHATIAGVALGLLTPARPFRGREVLRDLEQRLHPLSAFVIIPIFALANAGVDLRGDVLGQAAASRLFWGVAAGLVLGKTLGIGLVTYIATRSGVGTLPEGMTFRHVWGVAALAAIGFTVSLFITDLAYTDPTLADLAKIGIFAGSLIGGLLGTGTLVLLTRRSGAEPR